MWISAIWKKLSWTELIFQSTSQWIMDVPFVPLADQVQECTSEVEVTACCFMVIVYYAWIYLTDCFYSLLPQFPKIKQEDKLFFFCNYLYLLAFVIILTVSTDTLLGNQSCECIYISLSFPLSIYFAPLIYFLMFSCLDFPLNCTSLGFVFPVFAFSQENFYWIEFNFIYIVLNHSKRCL